MVETEQARRTYVRARLGPIRLHWRCPVAVESTHHGEWRSLVAHPAGGRAVAGSNPVSPITSKRRCCWRLPALAIATTRATGNKRGTSSRAPQHPERRVSCRAGTCR